MVAPAPPDGGFGQLVAVERAASGRAQCHTCRAAIAARSLRVAILLDLDPVNPRPELGRKGYIHLGCAPAFTHGVAGLEAFLANRLTRLGRADRANVDRLFAAMRLVAGDARGRELARLAAKPAPPPMAKARVKRSKPGDGGAAERAVLADWLEERGVPLGDPDVAELVRAHAADDRDP